MSHAAWMFLSYLSITNTFRPLYDSYFRSIICNCEELCLLTRQITRRQVYVIAPTPPAPTADCSSDVIETPVDVRLRCDSQVVNVTGHTRGHGGAKILSSAAVACAVTCASSPPCWSTLADIKLLHSDVIIYCGPVHRVSKMSGLFPGHIAKHEPYQPLLSSCRASLTFVPTHEGMARLSWLR